ncbi:oxygen-insensitive NADPH nitroreductase [Oceanobacter sp. 4_MG-2023]|uniref:oxygen-insensitive NADPH nitroreductase n=1 Tax=Oceanobacter sp. 4_MG-2023 TaxID=3062623 RepID=UPI002734B61D|nr:oxygen-insensitive NADPH nitroreductase [Oceanobacter sp. 4_MG-2023]MDP2547332.1 oxygen-insensitive NADPH nitroreductase [Oceanobacter sp. 4_MG-2023]
MNAVIDLLKSHRSIRKFTDQPISDELLQTLVEAGQAAATSNHVQAYAIVRVVDRANREQLVTLSGGQPYVASCAEFLVFCADMKRAFRAAERAGAEVVTGMTEQLLVATTDAALIAQNLVVAAESEGLGICYIGGLRNNPAEVSELLKLPAHVYPVFGVCLGYPAQNPEVKPRLPLASILKQDYYDDSQDEAQIAEFDAAMEAYYQQRTGNKKITNWSEQLRPMFSQKLRPHMKDFLFSKGFEMK